MGTNLETDRALATTDVAQADVPILGGLSVNQLKAVRVYVDEVIAAARSSSSHRPPGKTGIICDDFRRIIVMEARDALEERDLQRVAELYPCARRFGALDEMPSLSTTEHDRVIEHLRDRQDRKTGRFLNKNAAQLLFEWGAVPRYPVPPPELDELLVAKGPGGLEPFNVETYLDRCENDPDWQKGGWGVGSHTGSQSHALLKAIDLGHADLVPVLEKGMGLILSHQDADTGLFGPSEATPGDRISGNLKVLGRLCGYMGMDVPRIRALADTLIDYSDRGLWCNGPTALYARNVAEVTALCLEKSDYRREDLYGVLERVAVDLCGYWRKGVGGHRLGTHNNNSPGVAYGFGVCGGYLNWSDFSMENPLRKIPLFSRGAAHRHWVEYEGEDCVKIREKAPSELVWNQARYRKA